MDQPLSKYWPKISSFKKRRGIASYFSVSKSGVITGAADNDPSTIATFAQVGATTGLTLAWLLALITPLAIAIEETSAKVGIVTHRGLGTLIKQHYGNVWAKLLGIIIIICNTVTIGADVAVMAEIIGDFFHVSWLWLALPLAIGFAILLFKISYSAMSRYLFIVTFALLLYFAAIWAIRIDSATLVQELTSLGLTHVRLLAAAAMALIGTIISPYLIFWQTTEEVENKSNIKDFYKERLGVAAGFIYTGLIALAIMLVASVTLPDGVLIGSAREAALMLKPLAGNWAFILFSLGIVSSGLIGIPVLVVSTAYSGSELFGWSEGLNKKFRQAPQFYNLILGTLIVGTLLTLIDIPPMVLLFYTQILNCLLVPILIIFLLLIANNKKIMGRQVSSWGHNLLSILAIILILLFVGIWWLN